MELLTTTCDNLLLLPTTYSYVLLLTTTYYYVLPLTTTYYYLLLLTTTYYYLLLLTTTYYYLLLLTTTYYYLLLLTYYYLLLLTTTYSYLLRRLLRLRLLLLKNKEPKRQIPCLVRVYPLRGSSQGAVPLKDRCDKPQLRQGTKTCKGCKGEGEAGKAQTLLQNALGLKRLLALSCFLETTPPFGDGV